MSKNYQAIEEYVIKCIKDINGFYEFIMKNVKILYRETKQEPIEELLYKSLYGNGCRESRKARQ